MNLHVIIVTSHAFKCPVLYNYTVMCIYFWQNEVHLNIGGGRDNIVTNNIFYNPEVYAIRLEDGNTGDDHIKQLLSRLQVKDNNSEILPK